jgi:NitT/TauT family transport system substrate-binding protein
MHIFSENTADEETGRMRRRGATRQVRAAVRRALLAVALVAIGATAAAAQTPLALKKIRIAVATRVVGITYPWLNMPRALGYWSQAGYDVDILPVGGSLEAIQQLVGGNVDLVQVNSSVMILANAKNFIPLRAVMLNTVNDWSVVALADGPVKDMRDFKGKAIGVPALSTGGMPLLLSLLRANGLVPETDVQIIAVGFGAPAFQAIRSDKVQGLLFFQSAITSFENAGGAFRYFHGDDWRQQPDFSLVTLQKTIDRDPAMVEAIVRGSAMGSVFTFANPDCVRTLQWARWPDTKASGVPDEATAARWDTNNLKAQMTSMKQALELSGGKLWGAYTLAESSMLQDFMLDSKQIDKAQPASSYVVGLPNFFERVNDFDTGPIKLQAERCVP